MCWETCSLRNPWCWDAWLGGVRRFLHASVRLKATTGARRGVTLAEHNSMAEMSLAAVAALCICPRSTEYKWDWKNIHTHSRSCAWMG